MEMGCEDGEHCRPNRRASVEEKAMIVTEVEAKTKICPLFAITYNMHGDANCIASLCMAWRREKDTYGDDYGKDIQEDQGFCGLGGKP